ncbi:MAG TPA: hypothetical protein VKE70_01055, partial [Candidatus Solibacter sp.]|nr:hypothetical protein [Candidatus Solibacter sp.]
LNLQIRGDRLDVFGNSGLVLAAYAKSAPAVELACVASPRNTSATFFSGTAFPVVAGETYTIELAAITSDGNNANYNLVVTSAPPASVSISPSVAAIPAGSAPFPFTAFVNGPDNKAVRWSLSPAVGRLSNSGVYSAPAQLSAPVDVTITAASSGDPNGSATAKVTVGGASPISATAAGVLSAASYSGGGVSPGEIFVLFGSGFGPASLAGATVTPAGFFETTSGGTRVFFDGVPAPMIYAVSGQLSAIVPYEVAGKTSTVMQVFYNGQLSPPITLPVKDAVPGFFSSDASGKGQAAAFNQDFNLNSKANPADRGSVVVLFGTGEGQTSPGGVDGRINNAVFPNPTQPVKVTIGGLDAPVGYFGAAPNLVSGVFQANVTIPQGAPSGDVPVVVTVGGVASPAGITIAVK